SRSRSTVSCTTSAKLPRPVTVGSSMLPSICVQPSPSSWATKGFSTSSSSQPIPTSLFSCRCCSLSGELPTQETHPAGCNEHFLRDLAYSAKALDAPPVCPDLPVEVSSHQPRALW